MNKRIFKKIILIILLTILVIYGIILFLRLSHNRFVLSSNIYHHIPAHARSIISFNNNHYVNQNFELDSIDFTIMSAATSNITYPLVVVKFDNNTVPLLLMRTTKEQETNIDALFDKTIAPHHPSSAKKHGDANIYFRSMDNTSFIITSCYNGIYAISRDYNHIKAFIDMGEGKQKLDIQIEGLLSNTSTGLVVYVKNTTYFFALNRSSRQIELNGQYWGALQKDSAKLSYNEMNKLLQLEQHYTDSIAWNNNSSKVKVWLNKFP